MNQLKVLTVVGTRPEIIRLAPTIKLLDAYTDHVLVHTGQNYDYELNEVFFADLGLRRPDHFLNADTSSLGSAIGSIITRMEAVLVNERPDAFLVLGDTNSSLSAVIARRMKIPVFHMEAGNRSFDENVPEETNRRLVDHVADYNLVYTEHARRNLLGEGIHPSRILLTGSPMREVIDQSREAIDSSTIRDRLGLARGEYMLVSLHREENVDHQARLRGILAALQDLQAGYACPILVSTHPRTRNRLEALDEGDKRGLTFHPPFGFNDYVRLQLDAKMTLSDSGTISEESSILGFPAVTLRDFIERPEALDTGAIIATGVERDSITDSVRLALDLWNHDGRPSPPVEYLVSDCSRRVVSFIRSTVGTHRARTGLRALG